MPNLKIHHGEEILEITVPESITLLEALRLNGFPPESPCNGQGTCGKCRVRINRGSRSHTEGERRLLTENDIQNSIHLACMTQVTTDMEITLLNPIKNASILTAAAVSETTGKPSITKEFVVLPTPSIGDQTPDDKRLFRETHDDDSAHTNKHLPLFLLQNITETIRQDSYRTTIIKIFDDIVGVESGNTTDKLYGVAVDIGTTTMAAYLYDLNHGKQIAVASSLNPQKKFGADVISRIDYTIKSKQNRNEMASLVRSAINGLLHELSLYSGINPTDVYLVMLAGNTTMIHLLLNIPAQNIASAPFIPATLSDLALDPRELNFSMNPYGRVMVLPSVSAYVGSDITAAVLSTGMYGQEKVSLLVDIGTNGEMVLGNHSFLIACSTAAGPAFEGANIACGIGGVEGAVSEVSVLENGEWHIDTIGGEKAVGICGSGLIDAIACMLESGILDETGRILSADEVPDALSGFGNRFVEINNQPAFVILPGTETVTGNPIFITQKDVRETQNAKAAIAAGIEVLIRNSGIDVHNIRQVYLAGGFGSYMRIQSALRIGLLPKELAGRITAVGNAAGAGAVHTLLSREAFEMTQRIAKRTQYLELSSNANFVHSYTENMLFDG